MLNIAIMGTGRIASKVAPLIEASNACRVGAVASRERSRAEGFAKDHGFDAPALTYDELTYDELAGSDIDAVYITLPNIDHPRWSERLLRAGKHVLCEKPLAWRRADAERVFEAARASGRVLQEAFMYLHAPQTSELRRIAQDPSGPIGRLRRIEAWFDIKIDPSTSGGDWRNVRYSRALAGGSLMDLGCYPVSLARWLTGREPVIESGRCELAEGADAVDVSAELQGTLGEGAGAVSFRFSSSMVAKPGEALAHARLIGERGVVEVPWFMFPGGYEIVDGEVDVRPEYTDRLGPMDQYTWQADAFAAACVAVEEHGSESRATPESEHVSESRGTPVPSEAFSIGQAGAIESALDAIGLDLPPAWD